MVFKCKLKTAKSMPSEERGRDDAREPQEMRKV
jgi:hypothetical protein